MSEASAQDQHFLDQVRKLVGTARLAMEEAEGFIDMIENPELRSQAQNLLDSI